jgi:glycine dehydrogenase subunit 1
MERNGLKNHPYIPNSDESIQREMLHEIGLKSLEDLHAEIPAALRMEKEMDLPDPYGSEYEMKRDITRMLNRNISCTDNISFLGAGCWQHFVPAVCDEINSRAEFLSAYAGEPYNDHGRFQTLFEYESLLAELLDTEVVNVPTFDWAQAAATSVQMASRITGRKEALLAGTIGSDKHLIMKNYCDPKVKLMMVAYDNETGKMDLDDLRKKLSDKTAAVYFENPSYLGIIEDQGEEIARLAHEAGALCIVGVDPSSLGVMQTPGAYGADIICGDLQPLGIHMNFGGGQSGFISTRNEERLVMEYPSRLFGMAPTIVEGEYGFGDVAYDRTSFGDLREKGKEYVGTQTALWGITAGVYLSLMGPQGMLELGQTILQKSNYTKIQLGRIPGVNTGRLSGSSFKEFVADFSRTGKTVRQINEALLDHGIFGGKDLSEEFPGLGQSMLICVTEIHTLNDIAKFVDAVRKIVEQEQ